MEKKEKDLSSKIVGIVTIILIVLIAIIIIILTNGHETHIWDDSEPKKVTALVCTAGNIDGALFTSDVANSMKNEVKITFSDDKLDKIFYSYNGVYRTNELAQQEETNLHIRYDTYMGRHEVLNSSLSPSYSTVETKVQITLYADSLEKINSVTAPLFFINEEMFGSLGKDSREKIASAYEGQGFSCKEQN